MGDLPSLSFFASPDCVASFSRPPSRSTSALPDAMAAMASSFNSNFCAAANGARVIPASTVTTTNLMMFLPTPSIRRGEAGRCIFLRQQRQHGKGRGGIGHEPGWDGARFVLLVHGGGLPAAAFGVLMRAQPGEGEGQLGIRRVAGGLLHDVGGEGGGIGVAARVVRRFGVGLEGAQRVHGPTAIGLLLPPDLVDDRSEERRVGKE